MVVLGLVGSRIGRSRNGTSTGETLRRFTGRVDLVSVYPTRRISHNFLMPDSIRVQCLAHACMCAYLTRVFVENTHLKLHFPCVKIIVKNIFRTMEEVKL